MPLNVSGPLSLGGATAGQSVNLELGKSATALISMNDTDLRTLFGVASGQISMSQGYGKSSFVAGGTKGYFCGGFSTTTQITGIQFSNEAQLDPAAALAQGRGGGGGVNSITRGYIGGGATGPAGLTQIDGIQFSNEAAIDPAAALVQGRSQTYAFNSTTRGYFGGGFTTSFLVSRVNQIDGIQFDNESAIDPAAALVQTRGNGDGVNSSTRGYFGGGIDNTTTVNQIDGIQFSDESAIDPAAALVQPRDDLASVNSSTRGYFNGGGGGEPVLSQIDGIQFDNEAAIDPAAAISLTNHSGVNSPTRGYFGGGSRTPSASQTIIQRLEFSTETAAATTAGIVQTRGGSAGVQDSNN